ncbi:MAG: hypothetical protein IKB98_09795 [Clostridia bacterium]|nr:hypothetical protein [Clostridia bacterium]
MTLTEDYVREVLQEASDILDNALPADMYKNRAHNINKIIFSNKVAWWAKIYKGTGVYRNDYDIEVSRALFEAIKEDAVQRQSLLTTLCHELIHTIDGCFNHDEKFMRCAELIKKYTNNYVCVTKSKKLEDWGGKKEDVSSYNYIINCTKCGQVWCYVSKPRDYDRIPYLKCGACGGNLIVKKKS